MKTETQVQGALISHQKSMLKIKNKADLETVSKHLNWSEQYTLGYMEGVEFAYKWVLHPILGE